MDTSNTDNSQAPAPVTQEEQTYHYAILQETDGKYFESWYYFIRYEGNEDALLKLEQDLDSVNWKWLGRQSIFDLEVKVLVSENTAREMTRIDLNYHSRHRKFDGELTPIDFRFKNNHDNHRINKVNKLLQFGGIENFVTNEAIPDNMDAVSAETSSSDEYDTSGSETESSESEHSECSDDESDDEPAPQPTKKRTKLPKAAQRMAGGRRV